MKKFNWILLSGLLAATTYLVPACSRQGNSATGQGGSDDPGGSLASGTVDGATEPRPPGAPMKYQQAPVTDMSVFFNTNNPTAFWSRSVNLSGVTVQQVFKDGHFIVVGTDKDHALPVQMSELHPEIKVGQKIDLSGVVNPTGHDKSQWNVEPAEQQVLGQHQIFIQERSIKTAGQ